VASVGESPEPGLQQLAAVVSALEKLGLRQPRPKDPLTILADATLNQPTDVLNLGAMAIRPALKSIFEHGQKMSPAPASFPEQQEIAPLFSTLRRNADEARKRVGPMSLGLDIAAPGPGELLKALPIAAFHVTPSKPFDQFDSNFIGSGQGAQTFGYGHYFAENPATRDSYIAQFRPGRGDTPKDLAARVLESPGIEGDRVKAIQELQTRMDRVAAEGAPSEKFYQRIAEARRLLESGDPIAPTVKKVTLNVEPEELLDLDARLGEQSPKIIKAVRRAMKKTTGRMNSIGERRPNLLPTTADARAAKVPRVGDTVNGFQPKPLEEWTGSEIQRWMEREGGFTLTSDVLREEGIPGVRFLDQGSRFNRPHTNKFAQRLLDEAGGDSSKAIEELSGLRGDIPDAEYDDILRVLKGDTDETRNIVIFPGEEDRIRIDAVNDRPVP
jgi:hypothetical protein